MSCFSLGISSDVVPRCKRQPTTWSACTSGSPLTMTSMMPCARNFSHSCLQVCLYLSTFFSISSNMTKTCHSKGASSTAATLKLVCGEEGRSQGDIATAAMASINQFLTKQVVFVLFWGSFMHYDLDV